MGRVKGGGWQVGTERPLLSFFNNCMPRQASQDVFFPIFASHQYSTPHSYMVSILTVISLLAPVVPHTKTPV